MIAHDRHKLTLVNFSQYGQPQALVVRWVYLWLDRDRFRAHLGNLMTCLLSSLSDNLSNIRKDYQ